MITYNLLYQNRTRGLNLINWKNEMIWISTALRCVSEILKCLTWLWKFMLQPISGTEKASQKKFLPFKVVTGERKLISLFLPCHNLEKLGRLKGHFYGKNCSLSISHFPPLFLLLQQFGNSAFHWKSLVILVSHLRRKREKTSLSSKNLTLSFASLLPNSTDGIFGCSINDVTIGLCSGQ